MAQTFGAFGPDTSSGLLPMPAVLAYYAIFFGFGALYYDARDDDGRLGRWWWLSLPAALLVALPLGLAFAMGEVEALGKIATPGPRRAIGSALQVTYAWLMTFGLMGLCRAAFSEERAWLRYVSDSSYWLYIAHLPLIIWGQMIVRDWPAPAFVKFTLVCGIVSGVLLLSYHTVVRYTPLGTLLNGPRTRPRRASRSSA
jgi:peptidoglycan/LPS O-acetylase OafA/YrhL